MKTIVRRLARMTVALILAVLGLGHLSFGLANFGFVEELPENVDVLIEGITASTAAGTLFWAAVNQMRRRRWALVVLLGGLVFTAGMVLSVSTGASTPDMLQVVIPVLIVGGAAWLVEERSQRSTE